MSWSSGDSPELSFDEPFCISERGCDNLLRRLTASDADVDQLDALLETVRFDANKDEWLTLLRLDDVFASGVFDDTGALIGVSTCVRYDEYRGPEAEPGSNEPHSTFGWCGNVVVDASFRGRGVARTLLRAALEDVGADGAAWLDASDMGISLYEKAGFEPRSRVARWTMDVPSDLPPDARVRPFDNAAFDDAAFDDDANDETLRVVRADEENGAFGAAARMDAEVFGADREAFLRAWVASAPPGASCMDERVGYALAHRRGNATYLGPWGLAGAGDANATRTRANARARNEETEAFVDAAVRRAVAAAAARDARARGEATALVVAYVPEPLAGHERGEGLSRSSVCQDAFAAGALMSEALARRGFARGDATTRMARRDPACGARARDRGAGKPRPCADRGQSGPGVGDVGASAARAEMDSIAP